MYPLVRVFCSDRSSDLVIFKDTFSLLGKQLYSAATRDKMQEAAGMKRINMITFIW